MKKNIIIAMALLLGLALPSHAQKNVEARVQLARERYAEGLDNIATNRAYEKDDIPAINYTTVLRQHNWPGSGMSNDKMEFYFNEREDEMEPYQTSFDILMVRRTYNMGNTAYFEEYVYDAEGNPLFWYTYFGFKDGKNFIDKFELRGYYFADGTLARTICKKMDEKGEMKTCSVDELVYEYGEMTLASTFDHALEHFEELKTVFNALYGMKYY